MMTRIVLLVAAAVVCAAATAAPPELPPWPLADTVQQALAYSQAVPLQRPTNLTRADYLDTINGIVQYFRRFQGANGTIIDQYAHEEIQYSTPCFAFAAATVWQAGLDDTLLGPATQALTAAIGELVVGRPPAYGACAQGHCAFFTKPVMFAYRILSKVVAPSVKAQWDDGLNKMQPFTEYPLVGNWAVVSLTGEYLRTVLGGFGNDSFFEYALHYQLAQDVITSNGLYEDHSGMDGLNPLPYDTFPMSGYYSVLLREGYNASGTENATYLIEMCKRAVWTHLLMQSPWGEIPTGGRSSQHQWNEAVSALAYEIYANDAWAAGDKQSACVFQRAARIAHESVRRWRNPTGELQIVKNHFDPALRWGYEVYSFQAQYNLLPASMLSAAYMYSALSDDAIPECTAFADNGGYVFQLPEHHLVIAAVRGTYVEIETASDPHYDSTGAHRFHFNNCATTPVGSPCLSAHTLSGPTAGPPQENGGVGAGAWWALEGDTTVRSLGNQTYADVTAAVLTIGADNTDLYVAFTVEYILLEQGTLVTENYTVLPGSVGCSTSVSVPGAQALIALAAARGRPLPAAVIEAASKSERSQLPPAIVRFGLQYPAFVFDGQTNTTITLDDTANTVTVTAPASAGWGAVQFGAVGGHAPLKWTYDPTNQIVSRNGLITPVTVETTVGTPNPSMSWTVSALAGQQ